MPKWKSGNLALVSWWEEHRGNKAIAHNAATTEENIQRVIWRAGRAGDRRPSWRRNTAAHALSGTYPEAFAPLEHDQSFWRTGGKHSSFPDVPDNIPVQEPLCHFCKHLIKKEHSMHLHHGPPGESRFQVPQRGDGWAERRERAAAKLQNVTIPKALAEQPDMTLEELYVAHARPYMRKVYHSPGIYPAHKKCHLQWHRDNDTYRNKTIR